MFWLGNLMPGFTLAIAASFQFEILPRKIPARISGVNFDLPGDSRNVVSRDHRRPDTVGRCMHLYFGFRDLLVGHRAVGGAEIDRAGLHLANSAAAANRLIVELNVWNADCDIR